MIKYGKKAFLFYFLKQALFNHHLHFELQESGNIVDLSIQTYGFVGELIASP